MKNMITKFKLFEENNIRNCSELIGRNHFDDFKFIFNLSFENNGCGGNPNKRFSDSIRVSLLQYAVYHLDLEIIEYLLEKGANPNLKTTKGETPLLELGRRIYTDSKILDKDDEKIIILKLLLKYGADLNQKNNENFDFFDLIVSPRQIKNIISYIPKEYNDYLLNKKLNEFNI